MNGRPVLLSTLGRQLAWILWPGVLVTLACCAVVLGTGVALSRVTDRLVSAERRYHELRQEQAQLLAMRATEQELKAVWEALPAHDDFPTLILMLTQLANANGVAIPGMEYKFDRLQDPRFTKAAISFQLVGRYRGIRRWLYVLETKSPALSIESLEAKGGRSVAHGGEQVVFSVRLSTVLRAKAV